MIKLGTCGEIENDPFSFTLLANIIAITNNGDFVYSHPKTFPLFCRFAFFDSGFYYCLITNKTELYEI